VICSTVQREVAEQGFSTAGLPVVSDGTSAVLRGRNRHSAESFRRPGARTREPSQRKCDRTGTWHPADDGRPCPVERTAQTWRGCAMVRSGRVTAMTLTVAPIAARARTTWILGELQSYRCPRRQVWRHARASTECEPRGVRGPRQRIRVRPTSPRNRAARACLTRPRAQARRRPAAPADPGYRPRYTRVPKTRTRIGHGQP
jgi:hypothetical protein